MKKVRPFILVGKNIKRNTSRSATKNLTVLPASPETPDGKLIRVKRTIYISLGQRCRAQRLAAKLPEMLDWEPLLPLAPFMCRSSLSTWMVLGLGLLGPPALCRILGTGRALIGSGKLAREKKSQFLQLLLHNRILLSNFHRKKSVNRFADNCIN